MKKNIILLCLLVAHTLFAPDKAQPFATIETDLISFNFTDEQLVDVINYLATKKQVNVVLPAEPIKGKVTISFDQKVSLTHAWDLLYTILDIAGYTMIQKKDSFQVIKSDPTTASSKPAPVYINTPVSKIPNIDKPIRYLYFFTNIQTNDPDNEVQQLLKNLIDPKQFKINPQTNSILITDKANKVRGVMELLTVLDQSEYKETVEFIKLQYADAKTVSTTLNALIHPTKIARRYPITRQPQKERVEYFSRFLKIKPETRTNSLIVIGKPQAIERLRSFIYKYIDVGLDSGKSILHIYQLQYLDANDFAEVLRNIVIGNEQGSTGQAEGKKTESGPERYFKGVIITTDRVKQEDSPTGEETSVSKYGGGNKLIIACTNEDWKRIRILIEQLDKPQPQVIIEVLIADLTLDDTRELGNLIRNPASLPFPKNVEAQAAMWGQVITGDINIENTAYPGNQSLQSDLLGCETVSAPNRRPTPPSTVANVPTINFSPAGTTLIEVSDKETGKTWSILKLLQLFSSDKIISHPHIITSNNTPAKILFGEQRFLRDNASGSPGGAVNIANTWVNAFLQLDITPRISMDTINMTVKITINNFIDPFATIASEGANTNSRTERVLVTNTNVNDGGIITLGGLDRFDTVTSNNQTPVLGDIPLLGYFFKDRRKAARETNLTIFISPTIVRPRLRGGASKYTKDYIKVVAEYSKEGQLFEYLKDPITHFFFSSEGEDVDEFVDEFLGRYQKEEEQEFLLKTQDTMAQKQASKGQQIAHNVSKRQPIIKVPTKTITLAQQKISPLPAKESKDKTLKQMVQQIKNPLLTRQHQAIEA